MLHMGRTDIASESFRRLDKNEQAPGEMLGITAEREEIFGLELFSVQVTDKSGAEKLGKPMGKYYTLSLPSVLNRGSEAFSKACLAVAELIGRCCKERSRVLIAALGNPDITPDALGNLAAGSIIVTRHLKEKEEEGFRGFASVALSRPGVLGSSGMESALQIKLLCRETEPELVIVIDAMAGADMERLCRCIQISDTGLSPGSGVGNDRQELSPESLGIPVLAIGIPTVADAGILGHEGLGGMFVTPRDIDMQVRQGARIIAYGINLALHEGLSLEDIDMLVG